MRKQYSIFTEFISRLHHEGISRQWLFWGGSAWLWFTVVFPSCLLWWGVQTFLPGGFDGLIASVANPGVVYLILGVYVLGFLAAATALHRHWVSQRSYFRWLADFAEGEGERIAAPPVWLTHLEALTKVRKAAGDMDRQIDYEVRDLRDTDTAYLQFPNFLAGALVGVGLIGTFVGLLGSLNDLSLMFGAMKSTTGDSAIPLAGLAVLVEQLQNPMKGMGTAFATSLYGLVGSLTLALMVLTIQRHVTKFWQQVAKHFKVKITGIAESVFPDSMVREPHYVDGLFFQLRESHDKIENMAALLQKREEKFESLIDQLVQINSSVSREVVTGSQKLLNQFVELQSEQNANVLMLSRQLKHQQQTLVDAIENIQKGTGGDRLVESLVIHTDALTNEVSKLTKAIGAYERHQVEGRQSMELNQSSDMSTVVSPSVSGKLFKFFSRTPKSNPPEDPQQLFETIEQQIKALDQLAIQSKVLNGR